MDQRVNQDAELSTFQTLYEASDIADEASKDSPSCLNSSQRPKQRLKMFTPEQINWITKQHDAYGKASGGRQTS